MTELTAFPIATRWITADDRVEADRGRMAVERGPIVYCVEGHDVQGGEALTLRFDPGRELTPEVDPALSGGCTVLRTEARSRAASPVTLRCGQADFLGRQARRADRANRRDRGAFGERSAPAAQSGKRRRRVAL